MLLRRPFLLIALILSLAGSALLACDCSSCKELPKPEAQRVVDVQTGLRAVEAKAATLDLVLGANDRKLIEAAVLGLVKQWLELHGEFYAQTPTASVQPAVWQDRMVETNRLMGQAFRDVRNDDHDAVREGLAKFSELLRQIDQLIGAPNGHYDLVQLAGVYEAFTTGAKPVDSATRTRWLDARLGAASERWATLSQTPTPPKLLAETFGEMPGRIQQVRAASAERNELVTVEAERLTKLLVDLEQRTLAKAASR